MVDRAVAAEYGKMVAFLAKIAEIAQRGKAFVCPRGSYGCHILFNEDEMAKYFDMIRQTLTMGSAGACLTSAFASGAITVESSNHKIWSTLTQSLKFSGMDFEHLYKILPSELEAPEEGMSRISFAESIVLSHTLLLAPVMQHYGPLAPKLDLSGATKKFDIPQPLLAVGMIGDCVKGKLFNEIKEKADAGDEIAQGQRDTLLNPERLQQKMCALADALLRARQETEASGLILDAVLVGSGAFGGSVKALAQPFADSLNATGVPFDNTKDQVNFFIFPPPKEGELSLEGVKYNVSLNSKNGLGHPLVAPDTRIRVLVAGFDPVSLAPHGVLNRAFSAEGQLCHTTDFLYRTTCIPGRFVSVRVPKGLAWESPAVFFAVPRVEKFKEEEGYETVRFVSDATLKELGIEYGRETEVQLEAAERIPPRVWNGDCFDGWVLQLGGVKGRSWKEVIAAGPMLESI